MTQPIVYDLYGKPVTLLAIQGDLWPMCEAVELTNEPFPWNTRVKRIGHDCRPNFAITVKITGEKDYSSRYFNHIHSRKVRCQITAIGDSEPDNVFSGFAIIE